MNGVGRRWDALGRLPRLLFSNINRRRGGAHNHAFRLRLPLKDVGAGLGAVGAGGSRDSEVCVSPKACAIKWLGADWEPVGADP